MIGDIVQRLLDRAYACKGVDTLCEQAALEIDRLRREPCPHVTGTVTRYCTLAPLTLTDAEREDIACAASRLDSDPNGPRDRQVAATLRGLLERLGGER